MQSATIDPTKLAEVTTLKSGGHQAGKLMCAMEAVAYVAGEKWSDSPQCACPVIAAFMRSWNDGLPSDADRTRLLLPLIPKLVGTRSTKEVEARRATMAADWFVREYTPAWLRLAGLNNHADNLAAFPEITSFEKTPSLRPALEAAKADAEAARSAAVSAAVSAAMSAARSAAMSAARRAAAKPLQPTTDVLQLSALALVERMIAATDAAEAA